MIVRGGAVPLEIIVGAGRGVVVVVVGVCGKRVEGGRSWIGACAEDMVK